MTNSRDIFKAIPPLKTSILILNFENTDFTEKLRQYLIETQVIQNAANNNTLYDCIICSPSNLSMLIEQLDLMILSKDCTIVIGDKDSILPDSTHTFLKERGFLFFSDSNKKNFPYFQKIQSDWERVQQIAWFCYTHINPEQDNDKQDGYRILKDGYGLCGSSSRAARFLAENFGLEAKVVTFRMEGLPFGRGESKWDTHTVCEVKLKEENKWVVCDAMANICYPYSLQELISSPNLADTYLEKIHFQPDERWEKRNYRWYSTSGAYKLAVSMKYPKVWYSKLKKTIQKFIP